MRADIIGPVGTQQPAVHLFLRKRGLSPAEVTDQFGPMRHCFKRPQPDHAGQRSGIVPRPVYRPRLLLHHPHPPGHAAIEIMVKRGDVRMTLPGIPGFLVRVEHVELLEKAERITVPARHIEVTRDSVMIELGEKTHIIVDNIAPRRGRPQDAGLQSVEADDLIRRKAPPVEHMRRIRLGHGQVGRINLVKVAVIHRPEDIAPRSVEHIG